MGRGLGVLLGVFFSLGCSSSYEPARSPRIATVMEGGNPTFVRDGVHFGSPVFGTGLVDAVQGNAAAEHHARVGRNLIVGGFVLDLVGLGSEIGGLAVMAHDQRESSGAQPSAASVGLVVGGLVAVAAGTVMILSGQPHIYDAINLYNDGLDRPAPTRGEVTGDPPARSGRPDPG